VLRGLFAMALKEFRQLRRDRLTIIIAILIPVIQLTIFGYAISTEVKNVTAVVVDQSHTSSSRRLVSALDNTGVFIFKHYLLSYGEAYDALRDGKAKAAIIIPPRFSDHLPPGESASVQVLVDGSDSTVANYVLNTVSGVVAAMAQDDAVRIDMKPRFVARARVLFNPDLKSSVFFVPALIVLILHLPLMLLTSLSLVRERAEGTLEQLIVTPIGRLGLMLGKLVPFFWLGVAEGVGVLLVMVYIFQVPVRGSIAILIVVLLLWIIASLALGLMISTMARNQLQAVLMTILIVIPSILLSGFIFPRESMPAVIYPITFLLPMTYSLNIVRGMVIRGAGALALMSDLAVLVGICIAFIFLATVRFQKRLG